MSYRLEISLKDYYTWNANIIQTNILKFACKSGCVKYYKDYELAFIHLVQEDICEDICDEVVVLLREINIKVVQYTKLHNIKHIIF